MGITELADLVRAGIAEDERIAHAALWAGDERWDAFKYEHKWDTWIINDVTYEEGVAEVQAQAADTEGVARHVVRQQPQRVLAEVAAKRRLLDEALGWEHDRHSDDDWYSCSQAREAGEYVCSNDSRAGEPCDCGRDERVHAVLQALATPYQEAGRG